MTLPLLSLLLLAQTPTEKLLLEKIAQLEARIAALEARQSPTPAPVALPTPPAPAPPPPPAATLNLILDTYYGFNFNRPASGTNELRAFDPSHNSMTVNQATVVLEQQTSLAHRRYVGGRVDFQFGQATNLLQGSPANEPRPALYRNIFQAYGTVLVPVGQGLTLDFGKFAGTLGLETNYAKDQFNYSRSYFFHYLPFYHAGLRASYPVNSRFTATYWLVNGANQTEDFNASKSQAAILSFQPHARLSGNVNFFTGAENNASFRVYNTYWTWALATRLTLATDLAYVDHGPRGKVSGGAFYSRYQLLPRWALAARTTHFYDRAGLFSGRLQTLRELTLTSTFSLADNFQWRLEYRRDHSNQPFFSTHNPASPSRNMDTVTLGLLYWWGPKTGAW